jgi:hypothetical protein
MPMQPATQTDGHAGTLAVAVLGADAVLAGLPATPVQLAHACLRVGYDLVVPASWGDELVAGECLRALDHRGPRPAVLCACPLVRRELLGAGADLASMLIGVVSPPVATARYLHALLGRERVHVTYIGACPGAVHADVDARLAPSEFLSLLVRRGITLTDEPTVFDSVIPPDRRRYLSIPGGSPSPDHLWSGAHERALVELDAGDVLIELADRLLSRECALIDLAPAMGCACSGAASGVHRPHARMAAAATEPPRAMNAVIDLGIAVELADPICTGPCVEPGADDAAAEERGEPTDRGEPAPRASVRRRSPAAGVRAIQHALPIARVAGRSLPRAYVSRRRAHLDGGEGARPTSADLPASGPPVGTTAAAPVPQGNGRSDKTARRRGSANRPTVETATEPSAAAPPKRSRRIGDGPRA